MINKNIIFFGDSIVHIDSGTKIMHSSLPRGLSIVYSGSKGSRENNLRLADEGFTCPGLFRNVIL